jgi:mono/diheme cytochrome c family protein
MPTTPQKDLVARKVLFFVLLAATAAAIFYTVSENRPWIVPESAKRMKNPLDSSPAAWKAIRPVYEDKCASCHGEAGKGDGHDASLYDPRPSNFTDTQQMQGVTDGELFYKLTEGHKPMPSFKKRLSDTQRWQLVLLIRSFASPAAGAEAK